MIMREKTDDPSNIRRIDFQRSITQLQNERPDLCSYRFPKMHEVIVKEGQPYGGRAYLVISGEVVESVRRTGSLRMSLRTFHPGDLIIPQGIDPKLADTTSPLEYQTATDNVKLLQLTRTAALLLGYTDTHISDLAKTEMSIASAFADIVEVYETDFSILESENEELKIARRDAEESRRAFERRFDIERRRLIETFTEVEILLSSMPPIEVSNDTRPSIVPVDILNERDEINDEVERPTIAPPRNTIGYHEAPPSNQPEPIEPEEIVHRPTDVPTAKQPPPVMTKPPPPPVLHASGSRDPTIQGTAPQRTMRDGPHRKVPVIVRSGVDPTKPT